MIEQRSSLHQKIFLQVFLCTLRIVLAFSLFYCFNTLEDDTRHRQLSKDYLQQSKKHDITKITYKRPISKISHKFLNIETLDIAYNVPATNTCS